MQFNNKIPIISLFLFRLLLFNLLNVRILRYYGEIWAVYTCTQTQKCFYSLCKKKQLTGTVLHHVYPMQTLLLLEMQQGQWHSSALCLPCTDPVPVRLLEMQQEQSTESLLSKHYAGTILYTAGTKWATRF